MITVMSFDFYNGLPDEVECLIDARTFYNPTPHPRFYNKNGLDKEYQGLFFSMKHNQEALKDAKKFARKQAWDDDSICIGVGCERGLFRSVAVAERISKFLKKEGYEVSTVHLAIKD
jgi:RNase adaptor protein for sRNA GlmZ degradation